MKTEKFGVRLRRSRGAALIELALVVVPLSIIIGIGSLELSNQIALRQGLVNLAREAAMRSYRECALPDDPPFPEPALDRAACLNSVSSAMLARIAETSPNAEIVTAIYGYAGTPGSPPQLLARTPTPTPLLGAASRLIDPSFLSLSSDRPRLCVTEVFYRGGILGLNRDYYEIALF